MSISLHTPDQESYSLAKRRTAEMIANWKLLGYSVEKLCISCYLQGARDMHEAYQRGSHEDTGGTGERNLAQGEREETNAQTTDH